VGRLLRQVAAGSGQTDRRTCVAGSGGSLIQLASNHRAGLGGLSIGFRNAWGFKVEFLPPHRGDRTLGDGASRLPALAVGAQPLECLDYLIRDPVPSVALHEAGVAVVVPAPARYAVHKLIVASRRANLANAPKDIDQAAAFIDGKAGGEPRLGTDSIYMARSCHIDAP